VVDGTTTVSVGGETTSTVVASVVGFGFFASFLSCLASFLSCFASSLFCFLCVLICLTKSFPTCFY